MGLVVSLFTEIGLRGLVRGLLGSGIKVIVFKEERLTGLARRLVACPRQNHVRVTSGSWLLRSSVRRLCGLVRGSLALAGQLTYVRVQARRGAYWRASGCGLVGCSGFITITASCHPAFFRFACIYTFYVYQLARW